MVIFETSRLQVRHLTPDDSEAMYAIFSNPDVTKWMGDGSPLNRESCERWIIISQNNYSTKGFGASAVIEKSTNAFIGLSGIVYDPERGEPEIIYAFEPSAWGKGYATELVPAILAYGLNHCGLSYILATIASENVASQKVVEKAGMSLIGKELETGGRETLVYRLEQ